MNNNNNSGSIANMLNRIVNGNNGNIGNNGNNGNNAASRSAAASSAAAAAKKKKKASIKRPSVRGRTANQVSVELDRYCREVMAQKVMEAEEKCKNMGAAIQKYMEKAAVAKQASVKRAKLTAKNHLAALNAKEKEYRNLQAKYPNYKTAKVNTVTRKKLKDIPNRLKAIAEKRKEKEAELEIEEQKAPLLAQLAALNALAPPKKPAAPKKQASQKAEIPIENQIAKSQSNVSKYASLRSNAKLSEKQRASYKGKHTQAKKKLAALIQQSFASKRNAAAAAKEEKKNNNNN